MTAGFIPYGRQVIDEQDIEAVVEVLRGDWLTTGPEVTRFEEAFASYVGAAQGVAVANGTAALHLAVLAAGIGPGDEVIVASMTFAASANCVRYAGADVVFADVREDTLTIDPGAVAELITGRTVAIIAVDYGGTPADLHPLLELCDEHSLLLIEDASHAPGAIYRERPVGSIAHLSTFSFHPVKNLTTGEGGMVTTSDATLAQRVRKLRNHGIDTTFREREADGTWDYDFSELGFNYRLPDINCALGRAQLRRLPAFQARRRSVAQRYTAQLADVPGLRLPVVPEDRVSAWHLYPIRVVAEDTPGVRRAVFGSLREQGIGVNVHYKPVHLHSYYASRGYGYGLCPRAEAAYDGLLSLPLWPGLTDSDQDRIIALLVTALSAARP